ncbi:glycosyltransferase-like protein LARGE [Clonorchis sinensis]|uniref:Glycosyltransferase-like protein LARGE n=1 Tax=Clonorchis sinensis TaxID=79923 RepID=G7Y9Z0_CLOSI|nr:glycosyltransferase-like protein LARGE [Clonorchis sinensis]
MQNPIHIHFVADHKLWPLLKSHLYRCELSYLKCSFYSLENYYDFAGRIPNTHHSGPTAMAKLWTPYILPHWLEKIILIDSDTLWNENIYTLWNHFDRFNSTQMIGIAWEQQSDDLHCNRSSTMVIPSEGVNAGLVLMHLWRMRNVRWDAISELLVVARLERDKMLYQSDQSIYNDIISLKPEWYYPLACEWNVQLYSPVAVQCCPIVWPDRRPKVTHECSDVNRSTARSYGYARIVHCDGKQKPEESVLESPESLSRLPSGRPLTIEELRSRYFDVYARFQKIPINCFV